MLIYLIIGLVFAICELCAVIYSEGYRERIINKISEIRDNLHNYGWNNSFKQCYVILMILALTIIVLTWPLDIIHRIFHKGILDFINK